MARFALALIFCAVLLVAACGGDSEQKGSSTDQPAGVTEGTPQEISTRVKACLDEAGFKTLELPLSPKDNEAPDATVVFQRGKKGDLDTGGDVAIYESQAEADQKLVVIKKSFTGTVEPHGLATVVYFGEPSAETRGDVLACL
jgi:hypothetical protein